MMNYNDGCNEEKQTKLIKDNIREMARGKE